MRISHRRLHRCKVRFREATVRGLTLLPFFAQTGEVEAFVVLRVDSTRVWLLPYRSGMLTAGFWAGLAVDRAWTSLREATCDDLRALAHCWHFDPWWLLKDERYQSHPVTALIHTSNCVERFSPRMASCWFSNDGGRLEQVSRGESRKAFMSSMLPEREAAAHCPRTPRKGWRLAPFWESSQRHQALRLGSENL